VVYARQLEGKRLSFIVSGMLWRDSLIMMDRETETLWSHVTGEAIRGPLAGKRLEAIPVAHTTWAKWKAAHPGTLVMTKDVPVRGSVYEGYQNDPERFGITRARRAVKLLPGKAMVHGTVVDGSAVAVADSAFEESTEHEAQLSGGKIVFRRTSDGATRAFEVSSGKELPVTQAYWFAWIAFYPGTRLIQPSSDSPG
jgi:hypothetical protein